MSWSGPWVLTANGYGLVVMTLASHARGRGFDPLFPYAFCCHAVFLSPQNSLRWREFSPGAFAPAGTQAAG